MEAWLHNLILPLPVFSVKKPKCALLNIKMGQIFFFSFTEEISSQLGHFIISGNGKAGVKQLKTGKAFYIGDLIEFLYLYQRLIS